MEESTKTYNETMARIAEKMATITEILRRDARKQAEDPKNWGYVGSLNYVDENLGEIINFIE